MVFSKLLSSCNFGEPGIHTMVQSAVFCEVTKIGDISNMKYRFSTSYKYEIPRSLCNLYVFKDILSRYLHCWNMAVCKLLSSKTRFCRQAAFTVPLLISADACMEITSPFFFFHPEREPFRMSQAEVT